MGNNSKTWIQASPRMSCPVCGGDHWCNLSDDGSIVVCRRESMGPFGRGKHKQDSRGMDFWVHRMNIVDEETKSRLAAWAESREDFARGAPLAETSIIDRAYRALLGLMTLSRAHRKDLRERGLDDETILVEGFGSWPDSVEEANEMADQVYQEIGDDVFGVPGWYRDSESGETRICRRGGGWVIPTADLNGLYTSLRIRLDNPWSKSKYLWISSSRQGGPRAIVSARLASISEEILNASVTHSEGSLRRFRTALVTEGEVKSIIASRALSVPSVSIPGVDLYATSLPVLRHLGAEEVLIAFDMDLFDNHFVWNAFQKYKKALRDEGYTVKQIVWEDDDNEQE